jgi:hypothetical protein
MRMTKRATAVAIKMVRIFLFIVCLLEEQAQQTASSRQRRLPRRRIAGVQGTPSGPRSPAGWFRTKKSLTCSLLPEAGRKRYFPWNARHGSAILLR